MSDQQQTADHDALEVFLGELASLRDEPVPAATHTTHLHAMLAARPVPRGPRLRARVARVAALASAKLVLAAGVATAATTGGLAATGHLPEPAQQAVEDVAELFGIELPASASDTARDAVGRTPAGGAEPPGRSGEDPAVRPSPRQLPSTPAVERSNGNRGSEAPEPGETRGRSEERRSAPGNQRPDDRGRGDR